MYIFCNLGYLESSDFRMSVGVSSSLCSWALKRTFHNLIFMVMQEGMCEYMHLTCMQITGSRDPGSVEWRPWQTHWLPLTQNSNMDDWESSGGKTSVDPCVQWLLHFFTFAKIQTNTQVQRSGFDFLPINVSSNLEQPSAINHAVSLCVLLHS